MRDEEIEKEAKEYAQGNFYSEQGFIYGYERGFEEGKKEKCFEQNKDGTIRPCEVMKDNAELKKENKICEEIIIGEQQEINKLKAQIEKMKCCKNCKNWNWKHNKCEKKLKGNCIKNSKWELAE